MNAPKWKFVDRFPIQDRMVEVVKLTIDATQMQSEKYRRQLRKLKYGS